VETVARAGAAGAAAADGAREGPAAVGMAAAGLAAVEGDCYSAVGSGCYCYFGLPEWGGQEKAQNR